MGGDRNRDEDYECLNMGISDVAYAHFDKVISDENEEITVFEGNYLSNIVPQLHHGFNASGGLWYNTERWVQDKLVKEEKKEVWIYSGALVHGSRHLETVGPNSSIVVPDQFYKVVIIDEGGDFPKVLAFLFPHCDHKDDIKENDIFKFLVSIDYLEAISNLNFFNLYSDILQKENEAKINIAYWVQYINY